MFPFLSMSVEISSLLSKGTGRVCPVETSMSSAWFQRLLHNRVWSSHFCKLVILYLLLGVRGYKNLIFRLA